MDQHTYPPHLPLPYAANAAAQVPSDQSTTSRASVEDALKSIDLAASCVILIKPSSRWLGPIKFLMPKYHLYRCKQYQDRAYESITDLIETHPQWKTREEVVVLVHQFCL